ncbi:VOC family protein [uncultured Alcanivorax sp.]|jgi:catechol 2,3-dioxygenase-like lactoylglutathione lyase family enzyme|uniref:VOC family protein n=1 Tax=Alcanivorax sp. TaxID=1872427 RepID=UPI002638C576|nr:VOC family protein [uncultured Alcanivorax sp.]MEE2603796.1 VOC family protein [Pseudomonadota bacterium]
MQTIIGTTQGVHHIGLTVEDIHVTLAFFMEALGFTTVGQRHDYPAFFISDGHTLITLWQAKGPGKIRAFDRHHHVGLHHLALSTRQLSAVYTRLAARHDVRIEFSPEPLGKSLAKHMMCIIPGGLRLELIQT